MLGDHHKMVPMCVYRILLSAVSSLDNWKTILASRTTSEGLVGGKSTGNKAALLILNCETEPVAKTSEFNQLLDSLLDILLQQPAGNYQNERFVEIEGVKDELAAAIGLIRENITVKKGMVIEGENIGIYVRSTNKDYPAHGSYGSLIK